MGTGSVLTLSRRVDVLPDPFSWLEPFVRIEIREGTDGLRVEGLGLDGVTLLSTPDPWIFEMRGGSGDGGPVYVRRDARGALHAHAAIYHLREASLWSDPRLLGSAFVSAIVALAVLRRRRRMRRARLSS